MAPPIQVVQVDDLKIIGGLQVDGRRPVADVARELGVPKSTVQRRLDTLIRERVSMVTAYADSAKLDLSIHVHLNVRVELVEYQAVIDAITALTEVRWVAVTTGPADIVAEAYFASPNHLHEFIKDKLAPIKGIASVETSVILSIEKLTFHWDAVLDEAAHHILPHVRLSASAESYSRPNNHHGDVRIETDVSPPEEHCRGPDHIQ